MSMTYVSIFQRGTHPIVQLGFFVVLLLVSQLIIWQGISDDSDGMVSWEASFTILLLFSLSNAIISLSTKNLQKYWLFSIFSYVGLAFLGGVLATNISGVTVDEAGHFRWLYMVFTFIFLIILTIAQTMRKIVEIAKKQDARLRGEE